MTLITSRAEFDSQCCDSQLQLGMIMINVITISELALKMAKFCREPRHYTEVVDLFWNELDGEDRIFADRVALTAIIEGLISGAFTLDEAGCLKLDDESMEMSDEELEEQRVEAVLIATLFDTDDSA